MTTSTFEPTVKLLADFVPQSWPRLRDYLTSHGMALNLDTPPRQFSGGFANLNYLVVIDGKQGVLRCPPVGRPEVTHDIAHNRSF